MIGMVVRHEDVGKRPARLREGGQNRPGLGDIDRRCRAGGGIVDEAAEIVLKAHELVNVKRHDELLSAQPYRV